MKIFIPLHRTTSGATLPYPSNLFHRISAKILFLALCVLLPLGRLAAQTPQLVKDINVSLTNASGEPRKFCQVGNTLFFTAKTIAAGTELWKSDGTESGTVMVKDILVGVDASSPLYLTNVGGTLYFTADNGTNGRELWKSEGTESGTVMVKYIRAGSEESFP